MSNSEGTVDLGARFGLRGKPYVGMDTPDFIGSQLGWTIGMFQDRFPNLFYVLDTDLGWSDPEILGLTYFSACVNEVGFLDYAAGAGFPYSRWNIRCPAGKWWHNTEMRISQGTFKGATPFPYFGQGGTEIHLTETNWKSLYGAQNNGTKLGFSPFTYAGEAGTSAYPIQVGSGYDWCHATRIEDITYTGVSNSQFNNSAKRHAGFNYWWPGENSGAFNCLFTECNDFGILVSGSPAYENSMNNSFFHNAVAGIGIRGCARSTMNFGVSGDFNPWMLYQFRQNELICSPNGVNFWPCFQGVNPGGDITMPYAKIEAFACNSSFGSYSACNPDIPGKGQMLARLTGRTHFGGTVNRATVHDGKVNTLIQVVDDFFNNGGSIPLDNSSIDLRATGTVSYAHWLHDVNRNKKWLCNVNDTDTQGSGFTWRNNQNSGNCYDVSNPTVLLGSIAATYQGIQPFINDAAPIVWDEATGPGPGDGYNTVTGLPY